MDKKNDEEEPVKTFGDYFERWWMVYMLILDMFAQLYEEFRCALDALAERAHKSMREDDEMMKESIREMDRRYHNAA